VDHGVEVLCGGIYEFGFEREFHEGVSLGFFGGPIEEEALVPPPF